jgi:hypothetical protein
MWMGATYTNVELLSIESVTLAPVIYGVLSLPVEIIDRWILEKEPSKAA